MKKFRKYLSDSVIDLERQTYAKAIFDAANTDTPKLKDSVKQAILQRLKPLEALAPREDYELIGSILTHRYRDDADLDINVLFKGTAAIHEKLKKKAIAINGKPVPGTKHPINFFPVISKEYYKKAEKDADAAFDIDQNKWIRKDKETPFNDDQYLGKFSDIVSKIDIQKGEFERDLIDLAELQSLSKGDVKNLETKINAKIKELETDINKLSASYGDINSKRRLVFTNPMSPEEITAYGKKNKLPENVVYKMLEKYYYFDLIRKLKDIIGDDHKLSKPEAQKLKKELS